MGTKVDIEVLKQMSAADLAALKEFAKGLQIGKEGKFTDDSYNATRVTYAIENEIQRRINALCFDAKAITQES